MGSFWHGEAQQALVKSIASVEELSSAEVVVAVRERSGRYPHVDFAVGIVAAFGCLATLLYVPWPFAWHYLLLDPAAVGVAVGLISNRLPAVQRLFLRSATRQSLVDRAAKAEFFDRGIHHTREHIGILIYISLHERRAALVADSGVTLTVAKEAWHEAGAALRACVEQGGSAIDLASAIGDLGVLLGEYLPRDEEDVNELDDRVVQ